MSAQGDENPTLVPLSVHIEANDKKFEARDVQLEFECNWHVGIGGSVWTSGEVLTAYLEQHQQAYRSVFDGRCVLELGSGTGYVGLMTATCFAPERVLLTDLPSHVACMTQNVDRNRAKLHSTTHIDVEALAWGNTEDEARVLQALAANNQRVDVILGTDIAYLRELYEPLLHTLVQLVPDHHTLILLAFNRADTQPEFFQRLEDEGFEYYKIAERDMPTAHRGKEFALFEIRRRNPDALFPLRS